MAFGLYSLLEAGLLVLSKDLGTVTKVETMVSSNDGVVIVREDLCRDVVSDADAFTAVEAVFAGICFGGLSFGPAPRSAEAGGSEGAACGIGPRFTYVRIALPAAF